MSGKIYGPVHDISTQVIQSKIETGRDGGSIRHEVYLTGGLAPDGTQYPAEKYVTFDGAIGAKAMALAPQPGSQQPVSARVQIVQSPKQRGGGYWTNYVLEDIAPQGQLTPMAMPAQGGEAAQPVQQPQLQEAALPNQTAQPQVHPMLTGAEEQKSEERRRSAMHAAFAFSGQLYQGTGDEGGENAVAVARAMTVALTSFVATGSFEPAQEQALPVALTSFVATGSFEPAQEQALPVEHTPESVQQEIAAEVGEGVVQVGTEGLPWDKQTAA